MRAAQVSTHGVLGAVVVSLIAGGISLAVAPAADAAPAYAVTGTIDLGRSANGMDVDPGEHSLYVVNGGHDSISVINTFDNSVKATIAITSPGDIAVDPVAHRAYVLVSGNAVAVIDTRTNTLTSERIDDPYNPISVAVDPGAHTVYVSNYMGNQDAFVIDTSTSPASVARTEILGSRPWAAAVDTTRHLAYVSTLFGGTVSVLRGTTIDAVTGGFGNGGPTQLEVDSGTGKAYVFGDGHSGGSVSVLDPTTHAVTGTLPTGSMPADMAIDSATHTAYITNQSDNSVSVVDLTDDTLITTVPVGVNPGSAVVDPTTHRVYVSNSDNTVSVISPPTRNDPTITAALSSSHARTKYGWYRSPVTATFRCVTHGAALTGSCPAPVTFDADRAGQSATRTVSSIDGGTGTVAVRNVNIDTVAPTVSITGVRNGATYPGAAPAAKCMVKDALSGVAKCVVSKKTKNGRTTVTAVATDRAGNRRSAHVSYTALPIYFRGVTQHDGAYSVKLGHTYQLVVVGSSRRPVYYDAAIYPHYPSRKDHRFHAAGHHRWTLPVLMNHNLRSHTLWYVGVKVGSKMHVLKISVS